MSSVASGPAWLNPAGGLRYHLRGLRHGSGLWWPFRFALAEWLYTWQPAERRLVVVGPSAGYCLEPLTLERFDELVCLEPDPVARFLFARRLSKAPLERRPKLRFVSEDLIVHEPERFGAFLDELGDAALLFSNFLGQVRVLLGVSGTVEDERLERVKRAVERALEGRSWASFHDRFSGALIPHGEEPFVAERRLSDEEVVEIFYEHHASEGEKLVSASGDAPLLDHLTGGLFPSDAEHRYFVWRLLPGHYHLIEATKSG